MLVRLRVLTSRRVINLNSKANMTILTAAIAKVKIGHLEIDGLMLNDGSFGVAVPQIATLFPYFKSDKNNASILLKRLMGKDFKTDKAKTGFNKNITSFVTINQFEKVLRKLDKAGDQVAESMSDDLIGLSLAQLFSDAFGVKFEQEERQQWLKTRQQGKSVRRTLTDSISDYIKHHPELSENDKKWLYKNCSDKTNLIVLGKIAKKAAEELGCDRPHLRDFLETKQLVQLTSMEDVTIRLIDKHDIHPLIAVTEAASRLLLDNN